MTDMDSGYRPSFTAFPSESPNEILPGLWMGGTHEHSEIAGYTLRKPWSERTDYNRITKNVFDAVVTMYAWAAPVDWHVEELRLGIMDSAVDPDNIGQVIDAARWAHHRWQTGKKTLIRCQAGLNRSGLVTALVLMLDGLSPEEAITLLREKRHEYALCNDDFVDFLTGYASEHLARV